MTSINASEGIDVEVRLTTSGLIVIQMADKCRLVLDVDEAQKLAALLAETARKSPLCPVPS